MSEHYYTENPVSDIVEKQFESVFRGKTLKFISVSGVFSFSRAIDKASGLLIENFTPSGRTVLDLGSGYGAIGLFIKAMYPELHVTLVDINNRAVEYTLRNAEINKVSVEVLQSDLYSSLSGRSFDDIVSNPPIAAGKKVTTQLINEAYEHLNPKGSLWLVAFHNKGGSTLKEIIKTRFGNVEDVKKSGGIRVYKAVKIQ